VFALAPVPGADNPDCPAAPGKPDSQDTVRDLAHAVIVWLAVTVRPVAGNDTVRFGKGILRLYKCYAVLVTVQAILPGISLKAFPAHG